ncbi:MAG: hypothetical protein ACREIA_00530 [Opitutaceae bacterium]
MKAGREGRWARTALWAAAGLGIVIAIGCFARIQFVDACFLAVFTLLQPALGSMFLILIHRMTGGQWGRLLRAQLHAGAMLAPWIWLLLLPFLFLPRPGGEMHITHDSLALYMGAPMQGARFAIIWIALLLLSWALRRSETHPEMRWVGPGGFIGLVFLLHLAAADWLFTLQPGWYSTGFPIVWMSGQTVSALAAALAFAIRTGADPGATGSSGRPEGIDWGNLLMAAVLFWSYVAFTHFLIMWMGNISQEIAWYTQRATTAWEWIIGALAVFHLGFPLLLLFFRGFKRSRRALGTLATVLVALQAVHTAWIILPSLGSRGATLALAVAFAVAALAVFFAVYTQLAHLIRDS